MAAAARVGAELDCVADLQECVREARNDGLDFVVVPLAHPRLRRDRMGVSARRREAWTRSDLAIGASEWSRVVVGRVSAWAWRAAEGPNPRAGEEALQKELEWAGHLTLCAVLTPPVRSRSVARLVNALVQQATSWQMWVRCALDAESWDRWDACRRLCDHSLAVAVALELRQELPAQDIVRRWRGEPIKAVIVPTFVFAKNEAGFPVLSRAHQALVESLGALLDPHVQFFVRGRPRHAAGRSVYAQYLRHVLKRREQSPVEEAEVPYRDYLQAPLQPLADNLEAVTYETFERDATKYDLYTRALEALFADRLEMSLVVMVLGAGRGPLVRCVLTAAQNTGVTLRRVYAVEKNANALVTLRALWRSCSDWRGIVEICAADMRTFDPADKADCVVSELLGSFGDNELSPECLDGARRLLSAQGVSIPCRYESFVAPIAAAKLWYDARRANVASSPGPPPALFVPGAPPPARGLETPFVVKLHRYAPLAHAQLCFAFDHGAAWRDRRDEPDNVRSAQIAFDLAVDGASTVHGLAGYFEAQLYDDVRISINPESHSEGMFSWFPLFLPFSEPVHLPPHTQLKVDIWRCVDDTRVWYEWAVVEPIILPIQNPNGRSYAMRL